ncbi:WhiB family transcriptional regulator [Rhodococcoides fascians]|uniref:WhiB family transcriptional regulator n=1 Tax=Rhodococcoides fascians TaxID=1828 RepID=UPI00068B3A61|nr:WhiB family transcriptional regulator [Rhodococcus fascians]
MQGLCRNQDPALFFGPPDSDVPGQTDVDIAKAYCAQCLVLYQCRDYALAAQEPFGIWGGLTERERRQYKWFHFPPSSRSDLLGSADQST